jgi:Dipeptidyl aminopeptidases/acylaminoacyl-peptidases
MKIWIALPAAAVALAAGGIFAVDRRFRIPQVPHRRDPGDFGIPFTAIRFPTVRGRSLYGWWIPAAGGDVNAPAIVLVHGWSRNVERVLPFIRRLHPAGFNLLAFDARSHGSSDKDGIANMLKFSEDVRAAVTEAVRRGAAPGRIGVLGLSVGGAAAIHAAAHDPRIGAVLTIGAFAHPGDLMCEDMRRKGFPGLAIAAILRYVEHNVGARLDVIAPEANVGRITPPLLLVHGEEDAIVPVTHGHRLAAAAPPAHGRSSSPGAVTRTAIATPPSGPRPWTCSPPPWDTSCRRAHPRCNARGIKPPRHKEHKVKKRITFLTSLASLRFTATSSRWSNRAQAVSVETSARPAGIS